MTIQYDPKRPFFMLLRWRGTICQSVVESPPFWVLTTLNLVLMILRYYDVISIAVIPELPDKYISSVGGLLVSLCRRLH